MSEVVDDSSFEFSDEVIKGPYFGIIYGKPGIGKSTLAKHAEKPFYIPLEKGCEHISGIGKPVRKNQVTGVSELIMPTTEDDFFDMARKAAKAGYKTIVVDGGMFLDKLFIKTIISANPKEKKGKDNYIDVTAIGDYNFSTGYVKLSAVYETKFFTMIEQLHKRGINVILIAHSTDITERDSNNDEYKKKSLDMTAFGRVSIPKLLVARSSWTIYLDQLVNTNKKRTGFGGGSVVSIADRDAEKEVVAYTRDNGAFDAKVRPEFVENIQDQYVIDINDESTSKKLFVDLLK